MTVLSFSFFIIVLFRIGQRNIEISIVTYFFFFLFGIKSWRKEVLLRHFFFSSLSFFNMRWRRRRRQARFFFKYSYNILIIVFLVCPFFQTTHTSLVLAFLYLNIHASISFLISYHSIEIIAPLSTLWVSN